MSQQNEDYYDNFIPVASSRGIWLTIYLVIQTLGVVGFFLTALSYLEQDPVFALLMMPVGVLYGVMVWGLWNWKRWAYYALFALFTVGFLASIVVLNLLGIVTAGLQLALLYFIIKSLDSLFDARAGRKAKRGDEPQSIIGFFSDIRVINVVWQVVFAFLVVLALTLIWTNILATLRASNLLPSFAFLENPSNFGINQSPDWYSGSSTYGQAIGVGIVNTLQIVSTGIVGATILGIFLGTFLLSNNWLVRMLSRVYVEVLRNTPLLVQIIFWYFIFILTMIPEDDITLPNEGVFVISLRVFIYLFTFAGVWFYALRSQTLARLTVSGVFSGIVLLEIILQLRGDSYELLVPLAIAGAVLIYMSNIFKNDENTEEYAGLPLGIGIMALALFGGHLILDLLASNIFREGGLFANPRVLYGEVYPAVYIARNGFVFPQIVFTAAFPMFGAVLLIGAIAALMSYRALGDWIDRTGEAIPRTFYAIVLFFVIMVIGWFVARGQPLPDEIAIGEGDDAQIVTLEQAHQEKLLDDAQLSYYLNDPILILNPTRNRFKRVEIGTELNPSFAALWIALVIYSSAFIGEIVRAGIQAVPWGQVEAARAIGLSNGQTLRMIILPQALRVIIPPLGNQYLNFSKNSSLATAIAFSDTYQVGQTAMNQSGQSITGFVLVLLVYLTMSLGISLFMNLVNSRFQLVTR